MSFNARYLKSTPEGRYPDMGDVTGRWYLAKPIPDHRWRVRLRQAWLVLTGEAEIIFWPELPGDDDGEN